MNIILYSNNCPRCQVLKKKLDAKGIQYETVSDIDEMIRLGILQMPSLRVNEELLDFAKANSWINTYTVE